ncbi:carotenoid oxygenase family protein [Streptomyces paradoxus]|uniref:carotenoid oxygenase family protein n=1 Tax=Streptomyces paradoxus TaxID=66375 RepID=UPI0024836C9B|nr:carotenoid oxygenase family protein [Streptomyces paradoxus]
MTRSVARSRLVTVPEGNCGREWASEAVFVPSDPCDGTAAEDDGYAIAYVHNPDRGASDLVILAARDFTGEPVARIRLPGRVPLGLHGSWIPDA